MATYNADAIQAAIDQDPAIGKAEAEAIHALLRGRTGGRSKAAPFGDAVHTCGGPSWGRLTAGCPRCDELRAGAAPKQGWGRSSRFDGYSTEKHSCQASNCAPICTWGDW
jgi:hypothetical protein